jgi:hypothetical protein
MQPTPCPHLGEAGFTRVGTAREVRDTWTCIARHVFPILVQPEGGPSPPVPGLPTVQIDYSGVAA